MKVYLLMKMYERVDVEGFDETTVQGVFANGDLAAKALVEISKKTQKILRRDDHDHINIDFRIDEHVITSLANNPLYCDINKLI